MSMSELDTIEGEVLPAVPQAAPVTLFRSDDPGVVLQRATETADVLARAVKDRGLTVRIQNRDFPTVEAWTMLGTMLGVFPVCVWSRQLENGWEARVEARTLAGQTVGAAEAQCTRSEKEWGPNPTRGRMRDDYALRSMAQTRATGKALRLPLGFVMTLAGYDATPAEEMTVDTPAGKVDAKTGEIVEPEAGTAATMEPPAPPEPTTPAEAIAEAGYPRQPELDTYVPPEPGVDDIPFLSTAPPEIGAEEDAETEIVYEPAQMARAALLRRTLGVMVSHGVPVTEEVIFERIGKLSNDGRSVFYGFGGQEFEDLSESQATKVMTWLEEGAKKHREEAV